LSCATRLGAVERGVADRGGGIAAADLTRRRPWLAEVFVTGAVTVVSAGAELRLADRADEELEVFRVIGGATMVLPGVTRCLTMGILELVMAWRGVSEVSRFLSCVTQAGGGVAERRVAAGIRDGAPDNAVRGGVLALGVVERGFGIFVATASGPNGRTSLSTAISASFALSHARVLQHTQMRECEKIA